MDTYLQSCPCGKMLSNLQSMLDRSVVRLPQCEYLCLDPKLEHEIRKCVKKMQDQHLIVVKLILTASKPTY